LNKFLLIAITFFAYSFSFAQTSSCPVNIGFENGDFTNWECFSGKINSAGEISVTNTPAIGGIHTILKNQNPQQLDFYGKFPVNCPNGSEYSIQLGNNATQAGADRISYSISIPANKNEYSIIYHYAVVFQNPNHVDYQQPKFTAKIFDETAGKYIDCGSFEYVASSGLPGFSLSPNGTSVYYKPWSPVTIKLLGYAGKNIRLEFTINDCTLGGHFGYAYIDVDENCTSPITGNVYCPNNKDITLVAPFGFAQYRWFDAGFSNVLSTTNTLKISPPPPNNTVFAVEITPFPGLGCLDTLYTTVSGVLDILNLQVKDTITACDNKGIDMTASFITNGSTPNLKFSYFTDQEASIPIQTPRDVQTPGKYYIKALNPAGCSDVKPVYLSFISAPILKINAPPIVCKPLFVNLKQPNITAGSDAGLSFSYWQNQDASIPIAKPDSITQSNTYFIKASNNTGCSIVSKVNVTVEDLPNIAIRDTSVCNEIDLNKLLLFSSNNNSLNFNYFRDSTAAISVLNANQVNVSGRYFVKATSTNNCSSIKGFQLNVLPLPTFSIRDSLKTVLPTTLNIADAIRVPNGLIFTYWNDSSTLNKIAEPTKISETGKYFIKGTDINNCSTIKPVYLSLTPPPLVEATAPNVFSPNNDGINDVFSVKIIGYLGAFLCNIYSRTGELVFTTSDPLFRWNGRSTNGKELPIGTYYWTMQLTDAFRNTKTYRSGSVTIVK